MDLGLKGKKAIVTGATRGIGRAIAELLTDEGADVAICARNAGQVEEAVGALKSKGVNAIGSAVDVMDGDALKSWVSSAAKDLGGLDILVANVSAGGAGADEAAWKANFDADVMGTVRSMEAALPALKDGGGGSIVIISTTAAIECFGPPGPYNAMKAGLINYAKNMSNALAADNVRVNCVSPGPIFIEGGAWNFIKDNMNEFYTATLSQIPMGRMGSAEDVANAVAFLASPASAFTTGTNVIIDGGFTKGVQY